VKYGENMSDLPAQTLLQQLNARPVSGEHLEVLGKHASEMWERGDFKTLSEAVVETVKHAGLAPEQVRRVVEFANTGAYLSEFKKQGDAHKVVDFGEGGPADPSEILKDLNDGGGGSVFDRGTLDYDHAPTVKTASGLEDDEADAAIAEMFATKTAGEIPYAEPFQEAFDVHAKLASMDDRMVAEIGGLEIMYADLADRLYGGVKQATLNGMSLGKVAQAWQSVAPHEDYLKVAFQLFAPRLLREGVFSSEEAMLSSADKLASAGLVNPEHPLVVDFGEFCEVLGKLAHTRVAREEVRESLVEMRAFLKEAAGVAGKVWDASKKVSRGAGKAVGGVAEKVVPGSGSVVEGVIAHAPHIGAAVGANEVRRHLKYDPTAQAVSGAVLKHVPGTASYQQHNYDIATGQG
jgi:hypothetical protein